MMPRLLALLFLLLVAAFLRLDYLAWGLPYIVDGDEFRVLSNGWNVYFFGRQIDNALVQLSTYPPLRSWEIATTRFFLALGMGEPVPPFVQALWGRFFSLAYALLGVAFSAQVGRQLGGERAGLLAAGFFALAAPFQWYGTLVLVDGLALMLFLATLWTGGRHFRQGGTGSLAACLLLAVLTVLAKYNYAAVLLLPTLLGLRALWQAPRRTLREVALPCLLPLALLAFLTLRTVNFAGGAGFRYEYLNPDAQLAHLDALAESGRLNPIEQVAYLQTPRSLSARLAQNFRYLRTDFSSPAAVLLALGAVFFILDQGWRAKGARGLWLVLVVVGGLSFFVVGALISTGGRQLFPALAVLIFAWAGLLGRTRWLSVLGLLCLLWLGGQSAQQWAWRDQPISWTASIDWLIAHAPDGAFIASETYLYELGRLNGYPSDKVFNVQMVKDATDHPQADFWLVERPLPILQQADLAAHFLPPAYVGTPRWIYRVHQPPEASHKR